MVEQIVVWNNETEIDAETRPNQVFLRVALYLAENENNI